MNAFRVIKLSEHSFFSSSQSSFKSAVLLDQLITADLSVDISADILLSKSHVKPFI